MAATPHPDRLDRLHDQEVDAGGYVAALTIGV
jgi:hypothetical protein